MPIYTCYFRDARGSITSFDFIECDGDGEAVEQAGALLSRRDLARSVEIVEGQRTLTIGAAIRPHRQAACDEASSGA